MFKVTDSELMEAFDEISHEAIMESGMGWWELGECHICFQSPEGTCDCEGEA